MRLHNTLCAAFGLGVIALILDFRPVLTSIAMMIAVLGVIVTSLILGPGNGDASNSGDGGDSCGGDGGGE